MLYLVEYDRPAASDYPGPDGDDANFETTFEGPAPANGLLDANLKSWIVDYGKANAATAAHVMVYEPKRLSENNFRLPAGQRLILVIDLTDALEPTGG